MTFKLTPAAPEHIPAIAALERQCFPHPWTEADLTVDLNDPNALLLTAVGDEGALLGYVGVRTVLDEGYINNVAVSPSCRRQGVGSALIGTLTDFFRDRLAFLTLEVRSSNAPAMGLYAAHGFREVGRRKNYYDDPKEDAVLMTLEFDHGTEAADTM